MKNKIKKISILLLLITIFSCQTNQGASDSLELSNNNRTKVFDSCFEVVVKKEEADSLSYEKELPWDLIPFNVRNDKFHSIGTAFAISENELLSAFHVLDLTENSLILRDYYIRDKNGEVYEIDQITSFSQARDFVKFSVKEKKFSTWLEIENTYNINETVYSAGNAYGEGIIVRKGNLIGTIPEDENGEWVKLRSSSDVNSGNSGGPLVNTRGNVIGVVIEKKDNIAYSLPIAEVFNSPEDKGYFHSRLRYNFALIPETSEIDVYDLTFDLPMGYKEIKRGYESKYLEHYNSKMDSLFSDNITEMFPNGESSLEALVKDTQSVMPQILFKNKSDMKWDITSIKVNSSNLKDNGKLTYGDLTQTTMMLYLKKPNNVSLYQVNSDPKLMMDLILEGINVPRNIGGESIRITSFGEPEKTDYVTDKYDREWSRSIWLLQHSDTNILTYSIPTPEGTIIFLQSARTAYTKFNIYDYNKMLDFIEISFYGKYKEWEEYLEMGNILPDNFKDITISRLNGKIEIKTDSLVLVSHEDLFETNEDTKIAIDYDIFNENNKTIWDIRKVTLIENIKENFMFVYKNLKPDERLREAYHESWDNLLSISHPYNEIPYNESGRTNLGRLLNYKEGDVEPEMIYTLFIAKEGKIDDQIMINDLDKLSVEFK